MTRRIELLDVGHNHICLPKLRHVVRVVRIERTISRAQGVRLTTSLHSGMHDLASQLFPGQGEVHASPGQMFSVSTEPENQRACHAGIEPA